MNLSVPGFQDSGKTYGMMVVLPQEKTMKLIQAIHSAMRYRAKKPTALKYLYIANSDDGHVFMDSETLTYPGNVIPGTYALGLTNEDIFVSVGGNEETGATDWVAVDTEKTLEIEKDRPHFVTDEEHEHMVAEGLIPLFPVYYGPR